MFDVGAVMARVGFDFDGRGADQWERKRRALAGEARRPILQRAGVQVDNSGFQEHHRAHESLRRDHDDTVRSNAKVRTAFGTVYGRGGALFAAAGGVYGLGRAFQFINGEALESQRVGRQTAAVLKSTGGEAGVSAKHVGDLAQKLSHLAGVDDEVIQQGENVLLTFTNVRNEVGKGNDVFDQATGLALDMSKALGTDLQSSVIQVGKALNDPIKGITALRRVGVSFTEDQQKQIKALEASGHHLDAQKIILRELRKEFGGTARATATEGDKLKVAFGNLAETVGLALLPWLQKAEGWLAKFIEQMQNGTGDGGKFVDKLDEAWGALKRVGGIARDSVGWLKDHAHYVEVAAAAWGLFKVNSAVGKLGGPRIPGLPGGKASAGGVLGSVVGATKPVPVYVVNEGFGGPGGGALGKGGVLRDAEGALTKGSVVRGVAKGASKLAGKAAALDFAINLVDSRGNPIAAAVNTGHDLTFGILPKLKVPTKDERQDKQLDDLRKKLEAAFNAPSAKPLQAVRREIRLMAAEADKFGDHDLAKRFRDLEPEARKTGDAFKGSRQQLRELSDRVDDARGKWRAAKAPLQDLKKGTDEYRAAVKIARDRQKDFTDAVHDLKGAEKPAARTFATIAGSAAGLGQVVADVVDSVGSNVNDVLKSMGAKALRYTVKHPKKAGHDAGALFGALGAAVGAHATGGVPNPSGSSQDDHVLLDPTGRPVALMSGTEGILNTPQMAEVDEALAIKRALGLGRYGGLDELWGSGMRHYQEGGALARANQLDAMHLPYVWGGHHGERGPITNPRPGLDCSSAVSYVLGIPPRVSGAFENYGQPGPGPITIAANPEHVLMALGSRWFGTSRSNPAGGAGWIPTPSAGYLSRFVIRHVDSAGLAGGDVPTPQIEGPDSVLKTIAQRVAQRVTRAGNQAITRSLGSLDNPAGQPLRDAHGAFGESELENLWRRANPGLGNAHLMAAIALAESRGDPSVVNSIGAGGLWQIHPPEPGYLDPFTNARMAGRKLRQQGLRAWETWTNGSYRQFLAMGGRLRRLATGGGLHHRSDGPLASTAAGFNPLPGYKVYFEFQDWARRHHVRRKQLGKGTSPAQWLNTLQDWFDVGGHDNRVAREPYWRTWNKWYAAGRKYNARRALGGLLPRFNGGGALTTVAPGTDGRPRLAPNRHQGSGTTHGTTLTIRALGHRNSDRIDAYEAESAKLDDDRRHYEQKDREYSQSDEVLIKPDGSLDQAAIEKRAGELDRLLHIRERILRRLRNMLRIARRVVRTYTTIVTRLRRSLRHAKKKDRGGIREQITTYTGKLNEWKGTVHDLPFDVTDARLDVGDIRKEGSELRGTKAEPQDDTSSDKGTSSDSTPAEDPDLQAALAAGDAARTALQQRLDTATANLQALTSSGDLGTAKGNNALASAAHDLITPVGNSGTFSVPGPAGAVAAGAVAAGGQQRSRVNADGSMDLAPNHPIVVIAQSNLVPGSTETQQATARAVASAFDSVSYTPSRTERVG